MTEWESIIQSANNRELLDTLKRSVEMTCEALADSGLTDDEAVAWLCGAYQTGHTGIEARLVELYAYQWLEWREEEDEEDDCEEI